MSSIDEKRVYDDREGANVCYLATRVGAVRVAVSDDLVGEYGVVHRGEVRDVAVGGGVLVVATEEDVVVDGEATGVGAARAVGTDPAGEPLAVRDDGTVCRPGDGDLGRVPDARAVDGGLVAAPDGVYRVGDGVRPAGLDDVRDVAGGGTPLAATADGLYALGPGWTRRATGGFAAVAHGPDGPVALDDEGEVRRGEGTDSADEAWSRLPALPDSVAPVDCGRGVGVTYVAGEEGRFAVRVDGGEWRTRSLGTPGVRRLIVGDPKGERVGAGSDRT
ncbi:MAG: hypothetical protein ABEJ43_03315 [Haloferacaceae archaeon]